MVTIKFKNVTVKTGDRFRTNQNFTLFSLKNASIDENSSIDEIKEMIQKILFNKVKLNDNSIVEFCKSK